MPIGLSSRKYQSELRGNVDLDFLSGCIGERIKVITEVYFEQVYIITPDNGAGAKPTPSQSQQLFNDNAILFLDGVFLNDCQVGDLLFVSGSSNAGNYVLTEIVSGAFGRFTNEDGTPVSFSPEPLPEDSYVANITVLKSLIYQYGLGAGGFNSPTDDSLQKFVINSSSQLSSIDIYLNAVGNKDWQFDLLFSDGEGLGPTSTQQIIKITHSTIVSPLFLAGQYDDMRNGLAPEYFLPDNKIKYSSQIDFQKNSYDVDEQKRLDIEGTGQFGWYGTKFNGSAPGYKINSLVLTRESDGEIINQLEYDRVIVEVEVESLGAAFDDFDNAMIFGFNYLPDDSAFYQNTGRTMEENFCFDSKFFNLNNTDENGDKYGTPYQVIDRVKGGNIVGNTCKITAVIDFGNKVLERLHQADTAKYAIWVISEKVSVAPELSDKTALLIQADEIHVQLTTVDLIDATTLFIEHPYDSVAYGKPTLELYLVDDAVANSVYSIDFTGKESDGILLKSVTPQIVLTHATEADIVLDSFRANLDNFPTVGSLPAVQDIDFNQKRQYKIEDGIRKTIAFERAYSMDSGLIKYYVLNFPFMNRWEYWIKIAGLTSIPEDLFDNTVPFGGANHLWNRLANISGWSLKYRTTFEIEQNGALFEQSFETTLTSSYFNSNTDWINCEIDSFDPITGDQVVVGSKNYAYAASDTRIKATFEKVSGDVPDLDKVCIVIWAEGFEGGGISEITRISSRYDVEDVSAYRSLDSSKRTVMTKTGSVFTGEALLKFSKVQSYSKVSIYARIYEIESDIEEDGRITNDYILRVTNDGQTRLILS